MAKAGRSARREYERRQKHHRRTVRRILPVLIVALALLTPPAWIFGNHFAPGAGPWLSLILAAGLIKELWPSRRHVDAWAIGEKGELKTEKALDRLCDQFVVFHDRRIPGKRANVDHIVVGPSGVFVVETKNVAGKVTLRRGELFVAGRRKQGYVEETWREAAAVQGAVSEVAARLGIDVQPIMCFHRAELPWGKTVVAGVRLLYPKPMVRIMRKAPRILDAAQVAEIAVMIEQRLVPA